MKNDRIRELYRQSHTDGFFGLAFDPEKFAELIVRECASVGYDASYFECALNVSNKILEHFGVE